MQLKSMLSYILLGIGIAEAIFAIGYGWLWYQYSYGIESSVLWPIALVALMGAMVAILARLILRNPVLD